MDHHHSDRGIDRASLLHQLLWIAGFAAVAAGVAYYVSSRPMDFRVYHYGANGVFDGTRPVYGPASGLGWPMHYRYPPLFLLLFAPFAWMPLSAGAAAWAGLKVIVLGRLIPILRMEPTQVRYGLASVLIPFLLAGPYVVEDLRYGNVQFFIFALTAAALHLARKRPLFSAAGLALAISIKVWPLFFLPYLGARREWKVIAWTLGLTLILALLPASYFGFSGTLDLLAQWFSQEFQTQLGQSEIWFPNQSLRGVLMRYFTSIDYSVVPDSNYPAVNIVSWDARIVRIVWISIGAAAYLAFLRFAYRRHESDGIFESALGFCLLAVLEPFTQKYALVVLLAPAIVAGQIRWAGTPRILLYSSIVAVVIQPLAPGSAMQRLLQVLGMDFLATVLLALALSLYAYTVSHSENQKLEARYGFGA